MYRQSGGNHGTDCNGSKYFQFRYTLHGKEKISQLGSYPGSTAEQTPVPATEFSVGSNLGEVNWFVRHDCPLIMGRSSLKSSNQIQSAHQPFRLTSIDFGRNLRKFCWIRVIASRYYQEEKAYSHWYSSKMKY